MKQHQNSYGEQTVAALRWQPTDAVEFTLTADTAAASIRLVSGFRVAGNHQIDHKSSCIDLVLPT